MKVYTHCRRASVLSLFCFRGDKTRRRAAQSGEIHLCLSLTLSLPLFSSSTVSFSVLSARERASERRGQTRISIIHDRCGKLAALFPLSASASLSPSTSLLRSRYLFELRSVWAFSFSLPLSPLSLGAYRFRARVCLARGTIFSPRCRNNSSTRLTFAAVALSSSCSAPESEPESYTRCFTIVLLLSDVAFTYHSWLFKLIFFFVLKRTATVWNFVLFSLLVPFFLFIFCGEGNLRCRHAWHA